MEIVVQFQVHLPGIYLLLIWNVPNIYQVQYVLSSYQVYTRYIQGWILYFYP